MRPLSLPLLGILTFSSLSPVLAAEPLAAILPDNSKVFFNVSKVTEGMLGSSAGPGWIVWGLPVVKD